MSEQVFEYRRKVDEGIEKLLMLAGCDKRERYILNKYLDRIPVREISKDTLQFQWEIGPTRTWEIIQEAKTKVDKLINAINNIDRLPHSGPSLPCAYTAPIGPINFL